MALTNEQIRVIQKMFRKTREKTDDLARAKFRREVPEDELKAIAAQNVLRDVLSVILNECSPHGEQLPLSLAARMASYCISHLPIEMQEASLKAVGEILPSIHMNRLAAGIHLDSTWSTNGVEHKNMPAKGDIQ